MKFIVQEAGSLEYINDEGNPYILQVTHDDELDVTRRKILDIEIPEGAIDDEQFLSDIRYSKTLTEVQKICEGYNV